MLQSRRILCTVRRRGVRYISQGDNEPPPRKSQDFFDLEAEQRRYYYNMDTRGFLFLENAEEVDVNGKSKQKKKPVRNMATALKDEKFLYVVCYLLDCYECMRALSVSPRSSIFPSACYMSQSHSLYCTVLLSHHLLFHSCSNSLGHFSIEC